MARAEYLVVRRAGGDGERVALGPARPITLGRAGERDRPDGRLGLARARARLLRDGSWWVEDLGARTGRR